MSGWTGGATEGAVPGNGGVSAKANSAVVDWSTDRDASDGVETLVVPQDNLGICP